MSRVVLSFLISFILLMIVIALNQITYGNSQGYNRDAEHSLAVIKAYEDINVELRSAELFAPQYKTSSAKELFAIYENDLDSISTNLAKLSALISHNDSQRVVVDSINFYIQRHLPVLRKTDIIDIISSKEVWRLNDIKRVHTLIESGLSFEQKFLNARKTGLATANRQYNLLTLLLAILAIAIITVTFFNQFFLSKRSKKLEDFLESVLNTSQNGILYCKAIYQRKKIIDFKLEFANQASKALLGTDPIKLIGKAWNEMPSLKNSSLFLVCSQVVSNGEPKEIEYLDTQAVSERWFVISIAKMDDGVTISFYESTSIKKAEAELKKNIAALETSNKELEEYAYAASHDLQEPLRKIRTFSSFLLEQENSQLDDRSNEYLSKIMQSAERMTMLIKDLLFYSSLQQKEPFSLTDLTLVVQNVLTDLEVLIAQKGAIITYNNLPEINAIPVQMNQLFYNLISNSLKFAKADIPLHLDISCRSVTADEVSDITGLKLNRPYYEITFSDNGIGFNPDYAHQIFGLFKRLNKGQYAGSGIGLSLCKKVVANHGGVIAANAKEGVGAQFYIYLPTKNDA